MTHDDRHPSSADEPAASSKSAFTTLRELRRRLRASPTLPEGDDAGAHQWRVLRKLCEDWGLVWQHDRASWLIQPDEEPPSEEVFVPDDGDEDGRAIKGSEHVCRRLRHLDLWEKVTKANSAGWWIDVADWQYRPATPVQYLERLVAANRVLGDDIRFVGLNVGPERHTARIRTTQPHILGESPSAEDIRRFLVGYGFREQKGIRIGAYDAMSFRRRDIWLFDVRPMNFKAYQDRLHPIDVIVQKWSPQPRPSRFGGTAKLTGPGGELRCAHSPPE